MDKLRIVGGRNGSGIKEIRVGNREMPLNRLSNFKYDFESPRKGILTLEYYIDGVEWTDVDSLKRDEAVETTESSKAIEKLRSDYLESEANEIEKYLEGNDDEETGEWHLKNASVLIKDALKLKG